MSTNSRNKGFGARVRHSLQHVAISSASLAICAGTMLASTPLAYAESGPHYSQVNSAYSTTGSSFLSVVRRCRT
jgi:hypothetical protein